MKDASLQPKAVERVGVLGAGLMGAGIAGAHIRRGIPVMMLDSDARALEKRSGRQRQDPPRRIDIGRGTQADAGSGPRLTQHHAGVACDSRPRRGHRGSRGK